VLSRLKLRGDELLLDAGCGTGRLTAELLDALPRGRVVGVDQSQSMLDSAHQHLSAYGSQVSLLAADLLRLPLARRFDGVVSTAAFHWVLDHDRLFLELHRVIVPGGWLDAQCGGGPNLTRLRGRADMLATHPKFAQYFSGFREPWLYQDSDAAANSLHRAGFREIETSVEPALTILDDAEQYDEYVRNIILRLHLQRIPEESLRTEFMAEMTVQAAHDDPPFSLDYWRLNLHGRV
jgi:trans-aconitate 2-methyltransferase